MTDVLTVQDQAISKARQFVARTHQLLIDNEWVDPKAGGTIECHDPATEQVIGYVPAGQAEDVDAAVAAARAAFDSGSWPALRPKERQGLLLKLADLIELNIDELAAIETLDNGAPVQLTRMLIGSAVDTMRYFAGRTTTIVGQTSELSDPTGDFHAYTRKEAVGVVGVITPWNLPLTGLCNKISTALAAGCTVIAKPAELTSMTALRLGDLILEAGFPAGVVNIVTGAGGQAGSAMANHPGIDKISFTGSTEVGRGLVAAAAGNFKRLTLELGGKSPLIIMDDADLDLAVPTATMAIFINSGQVCFAGSRLFVHSKVFDKVVDAIAGASSGLTLGNGLDPGTDLGPLISARQRERVLNYMSVAQQEGASLVSGGSEQTEQGYYVKPTIFANTSVDARVYREEVFGPVLVANRFDDLDEVVGLANDSRYGLGAGVFSQNASTTHKLAKRLQAGNVWINCYGTLDPSMPYGGFKESGWGREFGAEGIEAFLETKSVYARID